MYKRGNKEHILWMFAEKEIVSSSGTSIPADGLIEIITLDEKGNGYVNTELPFGSYYVKELSTDEHLYSQRLKNIRLFLNTRVKRRVRLS